MVRLFDHSGSPVPERRRSPGRRDTDALSPEMVLGFVEWMGRLWRHRAKIITAAALLGSAAGCVVGYLGRAHDLDSVKIEVASQRARLDSTVDDVHDMKTYIRVQSVTVCSLSRHLDPAGTPAECFNPPMLRHP